MAKKVAITKMGKKIGKGDKIVRTPEEMATYNGRKQKAFDIRKFFRLHSVVIILADGRRVSVYEAAKRMQVNVRRIMAHIYEANNNKTEASFIEVPYTEVSFRSEPKPMNWLTFDGLDVALVKSTIKPANGICILRGVSSYSIDGVNFTKVISKPKKSKK